MTRKVLAIGGALVLVVTIVAVTAALQNSASRRAGGEATSEAAGQVPLFEPDPLWSQALPNKWTTGAVGGGRRDSTGVQPETAASRR